MSNNQKQKRLRNAMLLYWARYILPYKLPSLFPTPEQLSFSFHTITLSDKILLFWKMYVKQVILKGLDRSFQICPSQEQKLQILYQKWHYLFLFCSSKNVVCLTPSNLKDKLIIPDQKSIGVLNSPCQLFSPLTVAEDSTGRKM